MKTFLAVIGGLYVAAWVLASAGLIDMHVCFGARGACSVPASTDKVRRVPARPALLPVGQLLPSSPSTTTERSS